MSGPGAGDGGATDHYLAAVMAPDAEAQTRHIQEWARGEIGRLEDRLRAIDPEGDGDGPDRWNHTKGRLDQTITLFGMAVQGRMARSAAGRSGDPHAGDFCVVCGEGAREGVRMRPVVGLAGGCVCGDCEKHGPGAGE